MNLEVIPMKMLRGQLKKHITMELNKDIWAKDTDLEVISTLIAES